MRTLATPFASNLLAASTATTAHAQATTGAFFNQQAEIISQGTPDCLPGDFTGTETTAFTTSGRSFETGSAYYLQGSTTISDTVFTNGYSIDDTGSFNFAF